jgi:hypothetical protein
MCLRVAGGGAAASRRSGGVAGGIGAIIFLKTKKPKLQT